MALERERHILMPKREWARIQEISTDCYTYATADPRDRLALRHLTHTGNDGSDYHIEVGITDSRAGFQCQPMAMAQANSPQLQPQENIVVKQNSYSPAELETGQLAQDATKAR